MDLEYFVLGAFRGKGGEFSRGNLAGAGWVAGETEKVGRISLSLSPTLLQFVNEVSARKLKSRKVS